MSQQFLSASARNFRLSFCERVWNAVLMKSLYGKYSVTIKGKDMQNVTNVRKTVVYRVKSVILKKYYHDKAFR